MSKVGPVFITRPDMSGKPPLILTNALQGRQEKTMPVENLEPSELGTKE